MQINVSEFPCTADVAEILDCTVLIARNEDHEGFPNGPVNYYLGSRGDISVGIPAVQHSPIFPTLEALEAWLKPRQETAEQLAEAEDGRSLMKVAP